MVIVSTFTTRHLPTSLGSKNNFRMNECRCGCGSLVSNQFKRGHNLRLVNPMKNLEVAQRQVRTRVEKGSQKGEKHHHWNGGIWNEYGNWHKRLRALKTKTGICTSCGKQPKPDKLGRAGTDWSYVGSSDKGWETSLDTYIEECRSCNLRRR